MIKAIISDFSKTILFAKDVNYTESLNALYREISQKPDYNVFDYFKFNTELLDFYDSLKKSGIDLYIYTSEWLQADIGFQSSIKPLFKNIFSGAVIGPKDDPESYRKILIEINLKPEEVIFIDDSLGNIATAKSAGLKVIQYVNNEDLFSKIKAYLS